MLPARPVCRHRRARVPDGAPHSSTSGASAEGRTSSPGRSARCCSASRRRAEAIGAAGGWSPELFKVWYLAGAVLNAAWLGLGTAFLLGKTRFGYAYAVLAALGGVFTMLSQAKNHYPDVGTLPVLYLIFALVLALAIGVETYFQNTRWPRIAAAGVVAITVLGTILVAVAPLPAGTARPRRPRRAGPGPAAGQPPPAHPVDERHRRRRA